MAEFVLEGADELRAKLRKLDDGAEIRKLIRQSIRTAAKPVLRLARALAPVDTGRLRRSIKLRSGRRSKKLISVLIRPGTRADLGVPQRASGYYPAHIELGTEFISERRYLRGAMDLKRADAIRTISSLIGGGIERMASR